MLSTKTTGKLRIKIINNNAQVEIGNKCFHLGYSRKTVHFISNSQNLTTEKSFI